MLGVYICALLILFIAVANSGWEVVLFPLIGLVIYGIILCLIDLLREKNTRDEQIDREKAIDEWERKWGRKHPSRK